MYQVLDGAPVNTVSGKTVTPPRGTASVVRMAERYAIVVGSLGPIVVTAREFDRLLFEGQLRFMVVTPACIA
jgi:hypothetical protein